MSVEVGDRFFVLKEYEVKNAKGVPLCTYLPEYDYKVENRNFPIVNKMIEDGVAFRGENPARAKVRASLGNKNVTGSIVVKPPKKK